MMASDMAFTGMTRPIDNGQAPLTQTPDSPATMFDGIDAGSASFDDFDLFGPAESGSGSFDAETATVGNNDTTCSPLELQLSQTDSFFNSQPPSAAQTYLSTPALDELSTPEEIIMSADNTPLFDHIGDFGGQHGGADLFPPLDLGSKDFMVRAPYTETGATMERQGSTDSMDSPVPGFTPKTKGRKRTKALEPIDPSQGATEAEKKKKKNTLAARKSRARREAREQALEGKVARLEQEKDLLRSIIIRAGLPLPADMSFPERH